MSSIYHEFIDVRFLCRALSTQGVTIRKSGGFCFPLTKGFEKRNSMFTVTRSQSLTVTTKIKWKSFVYHPSILKASA